MTYSVYYYRSVSDLSELAGMECVSFDSKRKLLEHVRATKKKIASECKYRYPRDVVYYRIEERSI